MSITLSVLICARAAIAAINSKSSDARRPEICKIAFNMCAKVNYMSQPAIKRNMILTNADDRRPALSLCV